MSKLRTMLALLIAVLTTTGFARAQTLYGSLTGNVVDQTGAILPGIMVEVSRISSWACPAGREKSINFEIQTRSE